jgi:16S rRNA (uracil1498-N3)-methyltransferase
MPLRLYIDPEVAHLGAPRQLLDLPPGPARHVQVRRAQPGDGLVLFDGRGGEWQARVARMGRSEVQVELLSHDAVERELAWRVTLVVGTPANERMDWLVEKATELGVAAIVPVLTERTVLRLSGERAQRRREHWQGVAVAAAEQSGRTRVPQVALPVPLDAAWDALPSEGRRWLLSLGAAAIAEAPAGAVAASERAAVTVFSGPEGGLSAAEEAAAVARGFIAVTLGARILRAETAPLAVLAWLSLGGAART